MKHFFPLIILLCSTAYGQSFPKVDSLIKVHYTDSTKLVLNKYHPENWAKIENVLLIGTDLILATPDDDKSQNRNDMINLVLEWNEKGNYGLPIMDELGMKLFNIEGTLWSYYVVCMTNCYLKDKTIAERKPELILKTISMLVEYISDEKNITKTGSLGYESVKSNKYLNDLIQAKKQNNLKQYLQ